MMMDFNRNKEALNRELEQFIEILNELLPRYSMLLRKTPISEEELQELGEIEHFLIEVNAKITGIKNVLEEDLFGHSIDLYYKLKAKALKGDLNARRKWERMRENFHETLLNEPFVNWN